MKKITLLALLVLMSMAIADIKLPAPVKTGGEGIFTLLEKRASGTRNAFPTGAISQNELSTILWAATGHNRNGKGWTVPTAGGQPPYVQIYAVKNDGAFLYDYTGHSLKEISNKNVKKEITNDTFVSNADVVLVLVYDPINVKSNRMLAGDTGKSLADVLAGAMTQDIYLSAEALGIATRYLMTLNADGIKKNLKLNTEAQPICILPLAKK